MPARDASVCIVLIDYHRSSISYAQYKKIQRKVTMPHLVVCFDDDVSKANGGERGYGPVQPGQVSGVGREVLALTAGVPGVLGA